MKINLLIIFSLVFGTMTLHAQDASALLKTAGKALSAYNLDPTGNADKLVEAKDAIDQAFAAADMKSNYKANLTNAKINTELIANDYKTVLLDDKAVPQNAASGTAALTSIQNALGAAEKKFQKKEILSVLAELAPFLSVIGNQFIGLQDYAQAYEPLAAVMTANDLLKANGEKSVFESPEDIDNHQYVTAICAMRAEKTEVAENILMGLYESGSKEPGVYSTLYGLKVDQDEDAAMKILQKGQEIDPGNVELLFAEINYLIKNSKFVELEEKLKLAIEQDPDNPTIYSALGNVYMNLSEQAGAEGNEEKQKEYFDNALSYYQETLKHDDQAFDAYYSIGSLYFNQAAEKTKVMQELTLSKEDQMKYTELEKQTEELFTQALPFFKSAEMINPSDMNTIIALKEIFARSDDFEKSGEFKKRLETLQAGGTISESYFK